MRPRARQWVMGEQEFAKENGGTGTKRSQIYGRGRHWVRKKPGFFFKARLSGAAGGVWR
jgi:hypothetical protein